ncbi:MAG: hypothetical protein CMN28_09675 [Salinisphaeraceae bacterium]|jgi:hypothetical protein|nr:hypothetical protein [Salinisphaeraceae bacterium]
MRSRLLVIALLGLLVIAYLYLWSQRPSAEPDDPLRFEPDPADAQQEPTPPAARPAKPEKPLSLTLPPADPPVFPESGGQDLDTLNDRLPGATAPDALDDERFSPTTRRYTGPARKGSGFGETQWKRNRFGLESGSEILDEDQAIQKEDQAVGVGVTIDF